MNLPLNVLLIYPLCALLSFFLGFLAYKKDSNSEANRVYFLFTLVEILWIQTLFIGYLFIFRGNPLPEISEIFIRLAYGFGISMFPLIVIFFYHFPRVTFQAHGLIKALFYISMIAGFILPSFTPLVHTRQILANGVYVSDELGKLYLYYLGLLLMYVFAGAAIAAQKAFVLEGIEKRKVLVAAMGCWAFLLLAALTNVFLPMFGIYKIGNFYLTVNSPLYTLLFLLPAYYATQKYRFFNFSSTSLEILRNLILFSLFSLTVFGSLELLPKLNIKNNILLLLGSALLGMAVLKFAEKKIPELLIGSMKQWKNSIQEFNSRIYNCEQYPKLHRLIEEIFSNRLNLSKSGVYVIRKEKKKIEIPVYHEDHFIEELRKYKKDALVVSELNYQKLSPLKKSRIRKAMKTLEAEICIPLFSERHLIGFFILGSKSDKKPYSQNEIEELLKVKDQLEVALMNALLKMNLQEENDLMKIIIERKTKDLREKIIEIRRLLEQQSDFIAVTAHELRTPLNIALFQMQDILDEVESKKIGKDLKVVNRSLDNLKDLTKKLFDVQQYDLSKVELKKEKVNVGQFVRNIYEEFKSATEPQGIVLAFSNELKKQVFSMIDRAQFRQVLHNLMNNALKFAGHSPKIQLTLENGNEEIRIGIIDNGKGIPDEFKKVIFEKFRTQSPTAGHGLGLGLYIAKKITELHGGSIEIKDAKKGGAAFYVTLKKINSDS